MPEAHASCLLLHESSSHNLPALAEASQETSTSLTASASAATASASAATASPSSTHSNRKSRENPVKKSGGERGAAKGTADAAASLHAPKAITHKVEPLVSLKGQLHSPVFVAICFNTYF
jgi:hypothetical protein